MKRTPPLTIVPTAGSHIDHAFKRALVLSRQRRRTVEFRFNGTRFKVTPRLSLRHLQKQRDHRRSAEGLAWRTSPQGMAFLAAEKAEAERRQRVTDELIEELPGNSEPDHLIAWVQRFVDESGHVSVTYDPRHVSEWFERLGYEANQDTGMPREHYADSRNLAGYIIGQLLVSLKQGYPVPDILMSFCEDYFTLRREKGGEA